MSEALKTTDQPLDSNPATVPLDRIEIWQPHRFENYTFWPYFERLRKDDPVHYTAESPYGPFWSITKFEDIMYVDTHHDIFSSEGGITLDDDPEDFEMPMFIAMDPPKHDLQRKTVSGVVAPMNLVKLEGTIRERAGRILDELPRRRNVQLGGQGVHRIDHADARHLVRLPVRGSPQADVLVRRCSGRPDSGVIRRSKSSRPICSSVSSISRASGTSA